MPPRAFKPPGPSNPSRPSTARRPRISANDLSSDDDSESSSNQQPPSAPKRRSSNRERDSRDAAGQSAPLIPPALLTRICHEHFNHPDTKLGKDARTLLGKYMDTFVREALARAKHEMDQTKGATRSRGFLEVEDLEKLAPQLLLDF